MKSNGVYVNYRKWPDTLHWHFTVYPLGNDLHGAWFVLPEGSVENGLFLRVTLQAQGLTSALLCKATTAGVRQSGAPVVARRAARQGMSDMEIYDLGLQELAIFRVTQSG